MKSKMSFCLKPRTWSSSDLLQSNDKESQVMVSVPFSMGWFNGGVKEEAM